MIDLPAAKKVPRRLFTIEDGRRDVQAIKKLKMATIKLSPYKDVHYFDCPACNKINYVKPNDFDVEGCYALKNKGSLLFYCWACGTVVHAVDMDVINNSCHEYRAGEPLVWGEDYRKKNKPPLKNKYNKPPKNDWTK